MLRLAFIRPALLPILLYLVPWPQDTVETDSLRARLSPGDLVVFRELELLMTPDQKLDYLTLPGSRERSRWIDRFWVKLDPTPSTSRNERRAEHERRVLLARERYPQPESPGWDARGEVLIRYGLPGYVSRTDDDVSPSSYMLGGEIWIYRAPRMTVRFQRNYEGTYVCSVDPVLWYEKQFSKYTVPPEPDYNADQLTNEEIAHMMNPDGDYHPEDSPMAENEILRNIEEHAFVHSCDLQERMPCYFDICTFMDPDRSLRTKVDFEVPVNALQFYDEAGSRVAAAEFRVLVRDTTMKKVAFARDRIRVSSAESSSGSVLVPGQVALSLKPGRYWMGFEAYDNYTKKRASFTKYVDIEAVGGSLRISDIQFASSIREDRSGTKFTRSDLQIVPHPVRAYRIPAPVTFYFEIYGLSPDENGRVFYRVEYRVVPLEKKRQGPVLLDVETTVSSAFETSGYGATQPQRLSIATKELWKGSFRLDTAVTDRRTSRTTMRSERFIVLD